MCGLAGVAGTIEKEDVNAMGGLLFVSSFRGIDSTGLAGRSMAQDKGEIDLIKNTLASPEFLEMPKVRALLSKSDQLLMGHCRSRTVGDINKRNAQPVDFDNIIGTHNGTLAYHTKNKLEGPGKVCATDSEALWFRMDKGGFDDMLALTDDKDAMALVWYDKVRHRLNFYRNSHRPLFYCYSKDRTKVYWASEAGMLYLVLNRMSIKFEKVRMLPENLHWSQPLPDKKGVAFPKPETRFCNQPKAYIPPVTKSASDSAQTFIVRDHRACASEIISGGTRVGTGGAALLNQKPDDICSLPKAGVVVDLSKFRLNRMIVRAASHGGCYYKSDNNMRSFNKEQFEGKMNEGCCICGGFPVWGEPVKFLRDDNVVCASCVADARHDACQGKTDGTAFQIIDTYA